MDAPIIEDPAKRLRREYMARAAELLDLVRVIEKYSSHPYDIRISRELERLSDVLLDRSIAIRVDASQRRLAEQARAGAIVVHALEHGFAICGFTEEEPCRWPSGHRWIGLQAFGASVFHDENGVALELHGKNGVGCGDCDRLFRKRINDPGSPFP